MVNNLRRKSRRRYIETYEFPKALQIKLQEELGDTRTAEIALDGLRGWYLACLYADGRLIGMPSKAVDEAWHEMILMTREYTWFCRQAFGHYLHHSPESLLEVSMDELLAETMALVDSHDLPMVLFSADTDAGLEDGTHWHSTDLNRLRVLATAAEDRRRRERRRGSSSSTSEAGFAGFFGFGGDGGGSDGGGSSCGGGGCGGGGCGGGG
jgi:hypothetical protein